MVEDDNVYLFHLFPTFCSMRYDLYSNFPLSEFHCRQPQVKLNLGEKTKQALGIRAKRRKVVEAGPVYQLRNPQVSHLIDFGLENDAIGTVTTCLQVVY